MLVLGGRSGKTTIASAIASYEVCCTDWTKYVQIGELSWFFVLATREQQAIDLGRNLIFAMIKRSPYLSSLIVDDSTTYKNKNFFMHSRAGVLVMATGCAITALPCSSRVGRGYAVCGVIFDEIAWFARESKNEATDQGVYDSILPRQLQFGPAAKRVIISTPSDKSGLLYTKYKERDKNTKLYFCVRIPTWKMRTDFPKEYFENFKKLSPSGYQREFGAEFTDSVAPLMRLVEIERCLRETDAILEPQPDVEYVMAIDAAFGDRDRFAVAVGHVKKIPKKEIAEDEWDFEVVIDVAEIIEETLEQDLVEVAADRIRDLYIQYNAFEVFADDYQADAFGKLLDQRGVEMKPEPWTAKKHRSRYGRLRSLVKQRKISLPKNEDLVEEMCGLQVKYLAVSGQYTVTHKQGGHDDLSDAVAEIVFRITEQEVMEPTGFQLM